MSRVRILLTIALAMTLALAGDVAYAHTIEYRTRISIARSPRATVLPRGTEVTFSGRVRSVKYACVVHAKVLLRASEDIKEKTYTNATGHYSFTRTVRQTGTWDTIIGARVVNNVAPHRHTCSFAYSGAIRVRVG